MYHKDRIYGEVEIIEPIILELINTPKFQRLKKIDQAGYFEPFTFSGTAHTRFEHSVGVYILLNKYKAPLLEQISGLIHDVSHSVFSHCIDYVLESGSGKEQNHQDNVFEEFVKKSEIPDILRKYDIDLKYILDDKNFPLKEKDLPDLCADRIDYSLRTAMIYKKADQDTVKYLLNNLVVKDNNWVFKNFESAKKYAELFLEMNTGNYAGIASAAMYVSVGGCLRYALEKRYILKEDLYTTDEFVISRIKEHLNDKNLKLLWGRMNNKFSFKNNPGNYDEHVFCKSRIVDPLCLHDGEIKRLSEIEKDWLKIVEKESKPKEYFIKFEK